MKRYVLAVCAMLVLAGGAAHAIPFDRIPLVSNTIGDIPNRLCAGAATPAGQADIGCPSYSPYITSGGLLGVGTSSPTATLQVSGSFIVSTSTQTTTPTLYVGTNGKVGIGTTNPSETLHVSGTVLTTSWTGINFSSTGNVTPTAPLEVSGTVSATHFVGDGSGLTGVTAASSDRITSGTTQMVVVSSNGYVSLTQASTNTGWFDPTRGLVTLGVSATGGLSGTTGYFSGNVGIGTTSPATALQVATGGLFAVTGAYNSGATLPSALAGDQTSMFFYPRKGAFRAGVIDNSGAAWSDANIGRWSVSMGLDTRASGDYSFAMGWISQAEGAGSMAMNGSTTARGAFSTAMGLYTIADAYDDLVIGRYNVGGGTGGSWVATDPVFEIGIGTSSGALANAMTVLKNGRVGIGISAPTTALEVSGTVSATHFVGDGSGLTGVTAAATDRITSGSTQMVVVSNTGYVSLTQAGTNTGWFDPTRGLVTLGVSSTGPISGTNGYFSGNVGIGTSTPTTALQVSGGLIISTSTQTTTPTLYVGTNGNVGIGTTNPSATLHVNGGVDMKTYNFGTYGMEFRTDSSAPRIDFVIGGAYTGELSSQGTTVYLKNSSTGDIVFYGGSNERIRFTNSGKVGIGATNPSTTLHVSGTVLTTSWTGINFSSTGNVTPTAPLEVSGTVSATHFVGDGSGLTNLSVQGDRITSGTASVIANQNTGVSVSAPMDVSGGVNVSGSVGIGTNNPQATLDVSGSIKLSGTGTEVCDAAHVYMLVIDPSTSSLLMCRP